MKIKISMYIAILLCLIFIGNIWLHIIPVESTVPCVIDKTVSYDVSGNKYVSKGADPQIFVSGLTGETKAIKIDFATAVKKDTVVELYFPDENGFFTEANSRKEEIKKGEKFVGFDIPEGDYASIRVDINGDFQLDAIQQVPVNKKLAFADESICYYVWSACVLLAGVIWMFLQKNNTIYACYEKGFRSVINKSIDLSKSGTIQRLVLGIGAAALGGMIVESVVSLVAARQYNTSEMMLFSCVLFVIYTVIFMRHCYAKRIEIMVAILLVVCGLCFDYSMPISAGISWDDEIHYLEGAKAARGITGVVSQADQDFRETYTDIIYNPENGYSKEGQEEKIERYNELYETGECIKVKRNLTKINTIGYIPAIIGMWISYGLFLSFSNTILLARLVNVFFVAAITYFSMKSVKSGKMLIAVFAFVPTVFFLASSFSYDTWLTFMLLFGFSRYFGEIQRRDKELSWKRFLAIFIPLFIALAPKIVFAPLLFLTAYMPAKKFKHKKWCYAYRACFILAAVVFVTGLICVASGMINLGAGDSRGGAVAPMAQMAHIVSDLPGYIKMLAQFLKNYFSYAESANYLTYMAYAGKTNWQFVSIIILLFVAVTDRVPKVDKKSLPVVSKVGSVVLYVAMGAICATVMYLAFTPVGYDNINGCQGRYIIPALLPMLYAVSRFGSKVIVREKCKAEYYNMSVLLVSIAFLLCNLWVNVIVKY